jgi:chloramphenicol-sensitive protein RarD
MSAKPSIRIGVISAFAAYVLWGLLPLYWKLLEFVPAGEMLTHRIVWSCILVVLLLLLAKRWHEVRAVFANRRTLLIVLASSLMISANWYLYIWAVTHHHIVETSLGYYVTPLINVLLGVTFFRERLNRLQMAALVLAAAGVLVLTFGFGRFPWVALTLAITFGLYGLLKKLVQAAPLTSLAVETMMATPIALGFLIVIALQGDSAFAALAGSSDTAAAVAARAASVAAGLSPAGAILLLIGSGIATAAPLLLFARAAQNVPLSTLGFIQYVSPTISLLFGVFLFHESFTTAHAFSFLFIWSALILYSLSHTRLFSRGNVIRRLQ